MKKTLLLTLAASLLLPLSVIHAVEIQKLRCEYLKDPLGIDATKPRLSWVLEDDERGQKQTAYQILVASTAEILAKDQGDHWDSGKVAGEGLKSDTDSDTATAEGSSAATPST